MYKKIYNKLKKEIICSLNKSYYVSVEFMSKTAPLKIVINRKVPIDIILNHIKFCCKFYNNLLRESLEKIIVNFDCKSLNTYIFIKVGV